MLSRKRDDRGNKKHTRRSARRALRLKPLFERLEQRIALDGAGTFETFDDPSLRGLEDGFPIYPDFGDAPAPYPTRLVDFGATHLVLANDYSLGPRVDIEADGIPHPQALGDDTHDGIEFPPNNAPDDEDGVRFPSPLTPGATADVQIDARLGQVGRARLDAWVDFNQDGDWNDLGEQVFQAHPLVNGTQTLQILVPANAQLGSTFSRFRMSPFGGLTPSGPGPGGEVEDHLVVISEPQVCRLDWGDAPESRGYRTTAATLGPSLLVKPDYRLGKNVDCEPDGQPTTDALGDDQNGDDDDDGILFVSTLIPGQRASISVETHFGSIGYGHFNGLIDFNSDGDWDDPGEHVFNHLRLNEGSNSLSFVVPQNAVVGTTYARFMLSDVSFPTHGEVEDYRVEIASPLCVYDWGDAPESRGYPTTAAMRGPSLLVKPDYRLGRTIDCEPDGQPTTDALGDDQNGVDDDDGILFLSSLISGQRASIGVQTHYGSIGYGTFNGLIDFNGDGDWHDAGEHVFNHLRLAEGYHTLSFDVPHNASTGTTYARFMLSNDVFPSSGEVEDYRIDIGRGPDFGDAPDSYGTTLNRNGARHSFDPTRPYFLGASVDSDVDGQPTFAANGDDVLLSDDEDGVTVWGTSLPGGQVTIRVEGTQPPNGHPPMYVQGWFDWNRDGDFFDLGEQVVTNGRLNAQGNGNFTARVPATFVGNSLYARFRYSSLQGLGPTGAAPNGEVEDYRVRLRIPGDTDANDKVDQNDFLLWQAEFGKRRPKRSESDFNGDKSVDGNDFLVWQQYFGSGTDAPRSSDRVHAKVRSTSASERQIWVGASKTTPESRKRVALRQTLTAALDHALEHFNGTRANRDLFGAVD